MSRPYMVFLFYLQLHHLAGSLYLVSCCFLPFLVTCNGEQRTGYIIHIPHDDMLHIAFAIVGLDTKALAIQEQFGLWGIGECIYPLFALLLKVPMRQDGFLPYLNVIPLYRLRPFGVEHPEAHHRLIFTESRLDEPCCRIRFKGVSEKRIVPPFLRPFVALTPILDRTPVCHTDGMFTVHVIIGCKPI